MITHSDFDPSLAGFLAQHTTPYDLATDTYRRPSFAVPVDMAALRQEFERIKAAVQEEFSWLYGTTCGRCGGPATIQYTIWNDIFECGRCCGELVIWGLPDRTGHQAAVIDMAQTGVSVWEHGDRASPTRFLTETAFGREDQVRLVTQTLVNVLPDEDPEHRLPEGFLTGQELLAEQSRQKRLL